mgnify:CR=1 FL=1
MEFEKTLKKYYLSLKELDIYNNYNISVKSAFDILKKIQDSIDEFDQKLDDFEYYTKMFEMEEGTGGVTKILSKIKEEKQAMDELWAHIKLVNETFDRYLKMEWKDIQANEMEDETKGYQKTLTKMKGVDKKSSVFTGINKDIRNWLGFLPLISEMKNPAMTVDDDRHWSAIKEALKQDFVVEDDMKLKMFWKMNIYEAKQREEIEEITDRAKNESKIDQNLQMIKKKWDSVAFEIVPLELKEGKIDTLKMNDDEVEVLEEHQLLIQNIAASKFMGHFQELVEFWQSGLSAISDTVALIAEV